MKMQKAAITQALYDTCAFAVVRGPTIERGFEIARGLLAGGVKAMEVSYTLPNAGEVIAAIKEEFGGEMIVGAGTVMDPTTARMAIMAGAQFIVANCYSEGVSEICNLYQIPYAPGCTNVYGPSLVGLFKTPTPWMPLMASGGINLDNLHEWIEKGIDCAGMGGLLTKGSEEEIAANAAAVRKIIDKTRAAAQ